MPLEAGFSKKLCSETKTTTKAVKSSSLMFIQAKKARKKVFLSLSSEPSPAPMSPMIEEKCEISAHDGVVKLQEERGARLQEEPMRRQTRNQTYPQAQAEVINVMKSTLRSGGLEFVMTLTERRTTLDYGLPFF